MTNHHIRQGSTGNNDGTDWTNAWTQLPSALIRGDTYYIADGTYPGYSFDDTISGSLYINIKKATITDHGTNTGWQTSYGDGTAFFSSFIVKSSYININGQIEEGFRINGEVGSTRGIDIQGVNHVNVSYVTIDGTAEHNLFRGFYLINDQNITIYHVKVQNMPNDAIVTRIVSNLIIQYSKFGPTIASDSGAHNDLIEIGDTNNGIFRYNITNYPADQLHYGFGSADGRWDIYGNIFTGALGGGTVIKINSNNLPAGPLYVYNNVFYRIYLSSNQYSSSQVAYFSNNIFHNINKAAMGNYTFDTNYWGTFQDYYGKPSDPNGISGGDPFVNAINNDFHLKSDSTAINTGLNLGSLYSIDMDGNVRGADGVWDVGAYEYTSGECPTPIVSFTMNII